MRPMARTEQTDRWILMTCKADENGKQEAENRKRKTEAEAVSSKQKTEAEAVSSKRKTDPEHSN